MTINVAIVEDEKDTREGLQAMIDFTSDLYCCGIFEDAESLVKNFRRFIKAIPSLIPNFYEHLSIQEPVTLIVKVCGADVSDPPLAVPPSSFNTTVIVAEPLASGAAVYVSVPVGLIAGATLNSGWLLLSVSPVSSNPLPEAVS